MRNLDGLAKLALLTVRDVKKLVFAFEPLEEKKIFIEKTIGLTLI